jgi:hypothetical protein
MSGNYVGFVDPSVDTGISLAVQGANHATLAPSENATFDVRLSGAWSATLTLNSSDSENAQSIPKGIGIVVAPATVSAGAGPVDLQVVLHAETGLAPGPYTVAITVTDLGVQQTVYLFIDVT